MKLLSIIATITIIILLGGCSGNHSQITQPEMQIGDEHLFAVGVTDRFPDNAPAGGVGMLGVFNLSIDPSNVTASLAPVRQAALTDVLEVVDITNFLQMAPCTDCVKLKSVSIDVDGNLVLSIGIKHPFPAGDPLKPITGQNRADLHVLNIEGIVVSDSPATSFPGINAQVSSMNLINADGFTSYLDNSLDDFFPTDATIHPYITHFDDYTAGNFSESNPMGFESVTTPPPSGNLVMAMGCDYDYQDYVFQLDARNDFIFAVGCTYAVSSAMKSQRFSPEYRIPQHNKKAASEVSIEIITNDLKGEDVSSTAQIEIHVVDISHGIAVGNALNEMLADSSVKNISIEIPGVIDTPLVIDGSSAVSGTGHDSTDPLIYESTITNTLGGPEGNYAGLIKVTDNYSPGQNASPLLNGMDGIKRVGPIENPLVGLFNISEFATYQAFNIDVALGVTLQVISIVPDQADQHEFVDDAVISGSGFIDVTSVRLEMDTEIIEADNFIVDSDIQITADFDLMGRKHGLYDVVVEVQGGETASLEDGFEILFKCGTMAPEFDDVYTLSPALNTSWVSTILTAGPYDGYTLFTECNVRNGGYRVFDHTIQADNTPITYWSSFQAAGNARVLEPANENGLMIICASYAWSVWQVLDQTTGTLLQSIPINYLTGTVGGFDGNDDFWCIVLDRPDPSFPNIYEYYLQHWEYNSGTPSTPYQFVSEADVTSLFRDDINATQKWEVFGELVMDPGGDYCYVLTGTQGTDEHKIDKLDVTGPTPTIVMSYSFAGEGLDGDGQITIAQSRSVKMELDTSESDYAPCRLVVAGSSWSGGQYYMKLYRLDTDLNLLGSSSSPYNITSGAYVKKFYGMGLDIENDLICHLTEFTWGDPETYYGISTLPSDW